MTSKIGSFFSGIGNLAKQEIKEVKQSIQKADKATDSGKPVGQALQGVGQQIKDSFVDFGGGAIGYAELLGLKYSVKKYSFDVSPTLTRGSRLEGTDMDALKAKGFKGAVNLCAENNSDAAPGAKDGIHTLHLPIIDNTAPTEGQMKQFLDFVNDPANQPAYVHCEAGQGRTGIATACYRMAIQGWSPEKAIAEAKSFGMKVPDQAEFLQLFGADLAAGRIAGYPKT